MPRLIFYQVKAVGRVQSRVYQKKYEDGTVEDRTAYAILIRCVPISIKKSNDASFDFLLYICGYMS